MYANSPTHPLSLVVLIVETGEIVGKLAMGAHSVSITDLRVPPYVKNGTNNAAILDCLYSLRPEEQSADSGLVVKWFFNKSPNPVYQWIHNQKPQGLGVLKGRLWLDYRASDNNATAYRALYILNPTVELSGEYKCIVSTNVDEDFSIKRMIVWGECKILISFFPAYSYTIFIESRI
ncbi:hypothetical protein V9T40_012062 [Parthenolecanium corni]|uniref:Ig-like domain-containing protein n=1 Tax=Parthenolecanium corni TaxID=536013 RepID=A0AAN9XYR1_9HEMI